MSEETPEAAMRRLELRAVVTEGLALIVERAGVVAEAHTELIGEGRHHLFDPDVYYDKHFRRAVADLVYAAQVAASLNPITEE